MIFQSTHPSWGATTELVLTGTGYLISIHAPIVGCDLTSPFLLSRETISIHAPIVGCDNGATITNPTNGNFNPRTHRGVRLHRCSEKYRIELFQSTHPSWGATSYKYNANRLMTISIHAPIVGCDQQIHLVYTPFCLISIHAPIVGCDIQSHSCFSGE